MKKIVTGIGIFIISTFSAFAVDSDNIVNNYVKIVSLTSETFNIPVGYDLMVENATVTVPTSGVSELTVTDSGTTVYVGDFIEGTNFGTYNLVFRDNLTITNSGSKDVEILFTGYIFQEGSFINITGGEPLIGENGGIKPEYEFLRQNELFNFYQVELMFLAFLSIIVILKKYSFNSKKLSFK